MKPPNPRVHPKSRFFPSIPTSSQAPVPFAPLLTLVVEVGILVQCASQVGGQTGSGVQRVADGGNGPAAWCQDQHRHFRHCPLIIEVFVFLLFRHICSCCGLGFLAVLFALPLMLLVTGLLATRRRNTGFPQVCSMPLCFPRLPSAPPSQAPTCIFFSVSSSFRSS